METEFERCFSCRAAGVPDPVWQQHSCRCWRRSPRHHTLQRTAPALPHQPQLYHLSSLPEQQIIRNKTILTLSTEALSIFPDLFTFSSLMAAPVNAVRAARSSAASTWLQLLLLGCEKQQRESETLQQVPCHHQSLQDDSAELWEEVCRAAAPQPCTFTLHNTAW